MEITAEITPQENIGATIVEHNNINAFLTDPDPSIYVPYTGALTNVDLGEFSLTAKNIYAENVYTKTEIDSLIALYYTIDQVDYLFSFYYTSIEVDTILSNYALKTDLHDPVTLGTSNGLSILGQVLSLGLSSTNTTGALSNTDWNIFNGKQNNIGYTPENLANKNQVNGYAGLDGSGKIPASLFPPGAGVLSFNTRAGVVTSQSGDYTSDQITESLTRVFVSPTEKTAITHTNRTDLDLVSGTNTGDETQTTIKTKLGYATSLLDGYLTSTDWAIFNGKQNSLGFTPENVSNKEDTTLDNSTTKYPTNNLVKININLVDDNAFFYALAF